MSFAFVLKLSAASFFVFGVWSIGYSIADFFLWFPLSDAGASSTSKDTDWFYTTATYFPSADSCFLQKLW